jgi:hypothetical protein
VSNEELIAEARRLIADCATYNFGMRNADKLAHEVAGKLADALEKSVSLAADRDRATAERAWDEGNKAGWDENDFGDTRNPYRESEARND